MILEREYQKAVRPTLIKEQREDEMVEIEDRIESLKHQNEILKIDCLVIGIFSQMYLYNLGQQKKLIDSKRLELSKSHKNLNQTFDHGRHDETLLTFADDEKMNESVFNDISNIAIEKDNHILNSIDDNDFSATIAEIKEEDEESSENEF